MREFLPPNGAALVPEPYLQGSRTDKGDPAHNLALY